jgi:hypothetical protein
MAKYKLNVVAVPGVRCVEGGSQPAGDCTFFYGNRNDNHPLQTGFFVHKGIISVVKEGRVC